MVPWLKLGSARAPDNTELSIWKRGEELVVRVGVVDLMSNRVFGSEELLAEHGCAGLGSGAMVLIGGLGMGFTLRATLKMLPANAKVVVAELVPEIVDWVRTHVGAGDLLDDPRVTIDLRDVAEVLRDGGAKFDSVLLDVDNGPSALCIDSNKWLYRHAGLSVALRALKPGGRLAVWSASSGDDAFIQRLKDTGFDAQTIGVRARRGKGARQAIFLAVRKMAVASRSPR